MLKFLNLIIAFMLIVAPMPAFAEKEITDRTLTLGPGTAGNIQLKANEGSANPPQLRFNDTTSKWQKSDDGTTFLDLGDVVGPASNGVNAIPIYSGTSGKVLTTGVATLSAAGVMSALTGLTTSGTATFSGAVVESGATNDATATGSIAVIASVTSSTIRLTNASLVSIGAYANTTAGTRVRFINSTGNSVILLNDAGPTAAQGFLTGTGANVTIINGAGFEAKYNATLARWHVTGIVDISTKVDGPASSVDNHLARFDGTTGKIVQDGSTAVLSDAGILTGLTGLTTSGTATFTSVNFNGGITNSNNIADAVATGANATIAAPNTSTSVIRLTNASLTSVSGLALAVAGREFKIVNNTGNTIFFNHEDTVNVATATSRFVTPGGKNLKIINGHHVSTYYNTTIGRHSIEGGGSGSGGEGDGINLLLNESYEDALSTGWTNSGGTFSQQTYTNSREDDLKYARFVSGVIGQYFESTARVIPDNLGKGCMVDGSFRIPSGSWEISVIDNAANVLYVDTLSSPNTTDWYKSLTGTFPCPDPAGTVKVRVASLATGTIEADRMYLGGNKNLVEIAQSRLAGESYFQAVGSCLWSRTNTAIGAFSTSATCPGPTISYSSMGEWQTTDSDLPRQTINNLPKGVYKPKFITRTSTTGTAVSLAISDGTTTCPAVITSTSSTGSTVAVAECSFSYSQHGNRTFELYGASVTGTTNIDNSNSVTPGGTKFILEYYPDDSQTAVTSSQSGWFIDANIGGANPTIAAANVTSFTEVTNASLDLVLREKSAPAKIPCSTTNASTGLDCSLSGGTESLGIVFTPPTTGNFKVCANFSVHTISNASTSQKLTFTLAETQNLTQTIIQEGGAKTVSGDRTNSDATRIWSPHSNCGIFYFGSISEKTIRIMYESFLTGAPAASSIMADRSASEGQQEINITVEPMTQNMSRPVLTGDEITSPGLPDLKTCEYDFAGSGSTYTTPVICSGTCIEMYDSCNAVSAVMTRSGAGTYNDLIFAAGTFNPNTRIKCDCTSYTTSAASPRTCGLTFNTGKGSWVTDGSGGFNMGMIVTFGSSGTAGDSYVQVSCKAQKN